MCSDFKKQTTALRWANSPHLNESTGLTWRYLMKHRIALLFLILSISTFTFFKVLAQDGKSSMMLQPPPTEKKPKITEINGDRLVANYFLLREKTNASVFANLYVEMANAVAVR